MNIPAANLDLVVYDFDGVMTDNRVYVSQDGIEVVACTRADGLGVDMIRATGVPQLIISTETNAVVRARAAKLKLQVIYGAADKRQTLVEYCAKHNYALSRVLYVGNDMNDLEVMATIGFPVSPADGHPKVRALARVVTKANGGQGIIRELAEMISATPDEETKPGWEHKQEAAEDIEAKIRYQLLDAADLRRIVLEDAQTISKIGMLAMATADSLRQGGKVIFAGNGGSFADAQHLAAEFVGRFMVEREPLAALCLGTNSSLVTAVGNDYCFENIFIRELKALGRKEDVFIAISTSGNSNNLIEAVKLAEGLGITTYGLLGKGGGRIAELVPSIVIPSEHTARIQEMHITVGHILCDLVDNLLLNLSQA